MNTEQNLTNETIEMVNDVIEVTPKRSTMKYVGAAGLALLGCGLAYKFVVKPIINKKKAAAFEVSEDNDTFDCDYREETVED